jgi:hypothetical protein
VAGAITAYNAGATGKGIKIAIIDSGINPDLSNFAGRIDPASGDVAGDRELSDEGGHGTAVASVAAGARDNHTTMGVAFDATILSLRADSPGTCATKDGCSFYDPAITAGIDAARAAGARVINMSLGGSAPGADLLGAMKRAVDAGIVLVISAGNDGSANPDSFALTSAKRNSGMVIIAGSVGGAAGMDVISDFSDRAGTGADWYLMADGSNDRAPDQNGTEYLWSGTSFSAPTISGAVALLAQAFPNLTGQQIVSLLMNSGDDLGDIGIDAVYGHGRLNIARAFQPVGATSLASSQQPVSLTDNGDLPAAAGDANTTNSMGAVILDGYSRAYVLNLARTLRSAPSDSPLARSLRNNVRAVSASAGPISVAMTVRERHDLPQGFAVERMNIGPDDARKAQLISGSAIARIDDRTAVAFGFSDGAKDMQRRLAGVSSGGFLVARDIAGDPGFATRTSGSLAIRHEFGSTGVSLSSETGDVWQDLRTTATGSPYRWTSVTVDRSLGKNWLSIGMSRLEEKQSMLGGRMGEALGGGGSTSLFLDAEARHNFGHGWNVGLTARRGWTDFAAGKFATAAYAFDLAKSGLFTDNDSFGLRLAQPLRVEHRGYGMWLPAAYDYVTGVATNSFTTMSLSPSGRELDGELSYGRSLLGGSGWIGGNLFYRRQPGHIAAADDDKGAALRFTLGF